MMLVGMYMPGLSDLLQQTHLPAKDWGMIIAACVVHACAVELYKLVQRKIMNWAAHNKPEGLFYEEV